MMFQSAVSLKTIFEIERIAMTEYGIPEIVLMENAGRAVSDIITSDVGASFPGDIDILCGTGNNGGDGFVAARYLNEIYPGQVCVYLDELTTVTKPSSRVNLDILTRLNVPVMKYSEFRIHASNALDVYVDAVFGVGFRGELPDHIRKVFELINLSDNERRYSVDVPSGLNADTGIAASGAFIAYKTVTFGLAKKGFYMADGPSLTGMVIAKNIGFPVSLLRKYSDMV